MESKKEVIAYLLKYTPIATRGLCIFALDGCCTEVDLEEIRSVVIASSVKGKMK